eukprot:gnl/MRDRNA2_/MRDRNA2_77490_c0_seq1.p1 gnl/MRDRNA2_/MRDRNA2_77490_c0~~gnl/MRDRNA2_/MRDRNA2_77490_c0_seq1.p1  ORF type:complete len:1357 (+),score=276.43 gnl/MRDRNA2_/MRDRNA2_77490_c0_seq1:139-4209(+)
MVMRTAGGVSRREPQGSPRPAPGPRPGGSVISGRDGSGAASHSPHRCAPGTSTPRASPQPAVSPRYPAAQTSGATPQVRWPSQFNTRQTVPTFHWRTGSPGANPCSPRMIGHEGLGTAVNHTPAVQEAREASATPPRPPPGEHPLPGTLASTRPTPGNIPPSRRQRSSEEIQRAARQYGHVRTSSHYEGLSRHTVPASRWRTAPPTSNSANSPEKPNGSSPVKTAERFRSMDDQEGSRLPASSSSPEIQVLTVNMAGQGSSSAGNAGYPLAGGCQGNSMTGKASRACRGQMQSQIRATVPQLNWRMATPPHSKADSRQVALGQQQVPGAAGGMTVVSLSDQGPELLREDEADLGDGEDDDNLSEVSFHLSPIRTREGRTHEGQTRDQQAHRQQVVDSLRTHGHRSPRNPLQSPRTHNMSPRTLSTASGPRRSSVASSTLSRLSSTSDSSDTGCALVHETSSCSSRASGIQDENGLQTEAETQQQAAPQIFTQISPRKKDSQVQSPERGRMNEMRSGRVTQMRSFFEEKITGASRDRGQHSTSGERCKSPGSRERRQTAPGTPTMRRLSEATQSEPSLLSQVKRSPSHSDAFQASSTQAGKRAESLEPAQVSKSLVTTIDYSDAVRHPEVQTNSTGSEAQRDAQKNSVCFEAQRTSTSTKSSETTKISKSQKSCAAKKDSAAQRSSDSSQAQKRSECPEVRMGQRIARQRRAFDTAALGLQVLLQQQFGLPGSDPESGSSDSSEANEEASWQQKMEREVSNLYKSQAKMLRLVTQSLTVRTVAHQPTSQPSVPCSSQPPSQHHNEYAAESIPQVLTTDDVGISSKEWLQRKKESQHTSPDSQQQEARLQWGPETEHQSCPQQAHRHEIQQLPQVQQSLPQQEQQHVAEKHPLLEESLPTSMSEVPEVGAHHEVQTQEQPQVQMQDQGQLQSHHDQTVQQISQQQVPQEPQYPEQAVQLQQIEQFPQLEAPQQHLPQESQPPDELSQPQQQHGEGSVEQWEHDGAVSSDCSGDMSSSCPARVRVATPQQAPSQTRSTQQSRDDATMHAQSTRSLTRTESPARLGCLDTDAANQALEELDRGGGLEEKQTPATSQAFSSTESEVRRVSSPTRKRSQETETQQSHSPRHGQSNTSQTAASSTDNANIVCLDLESDSDSATEEEGSAQQALEDDDEEGAAHQAVDEPMDEGEEYGCTPCTPGMPREYTQLHHLEYAEMFQAVKVRMPEGTRPGQKIAFTFARRQHEATVDGSQLGSDSAEAVFTVCAKRPPLERNSAHAGVRGRLNVHCGYDRHHISEVLRQPPTIPQSAYTYVSELDGIVLRSHVLAERNVLYKYLMGKNMDPILQNTPEGDETIEADDE